MADVCHRCGAETDDSQNFCGNCGAALETEAASERTTATPDSGNTPTTKLVYISISVAALIFVLYLIIIWSSNDSRSPAASTGSQDSNTFEASASGTQPSSLAPEVNAFPTLTQQIASGLILNQLSSRGCQRTRLVAHGNYRDRETQESFDRLRRWTNGYIVNSSRFRLARRFEDGIRFIYTYDAGLGNQRELELDIDLRSGGIEEPDIELRGCMYLPRVEILDITPDASNSKRNDVTYRVIWYPDHLGAGLIHGLANEGPLPLNWSAFLQPPPAITDTVVIRYLDTGGWLVERRDSL